MNAIDHIEQTPLHGAANFCRQGLARLLVDAGARLDAKDFRGRTPADLARLSECHGVARMLERAARLPPPSPSVVDPGRDDGVRRPQPRRRSADKV